MRNPGIPIIVSWLTEDLYGHEDLKYSINIYCKVYHLGVSPIELSYTETQKRSIGKHAGLNQKPSLGPSPAPFVFFESSELQFRDIIPSTRAIGLYSIQPIEHTSPQPINQKTRLSVIKSRSQKEREERNNFWWVLIWLLAGKKVWNSVIHKGESEIEVLHIDPLSQRNMDFIMRLSSRMRLAHHNTHAVEGISSPNIQKKWDRHLVEQKDHINKLDLT